jgi:colanic acid biosynthesis glycosyl transferase WcaI
MTKRILVVSELYYPEETSTGYYLTRIAEGLAQNYSVDVLCSQPTYSERGIRAPSHEQHNGVHIQRCRGTTLNKDYLIFRLINLFTISTSIFFNAWRKISRQDIVLVVTNPPLLPFLINWVCQVRRARCLLLIHDVYPEIMVAAGMLRDTSILSRGVGWFTRRLYQSVYRIIVLGRDMAKAVAFKLTGKSSKIAIIPNWADLDLVSPDNRHENVFLNRLGNIKQFVIEYAGNMGRTHDIESLVQAAQILAGEETIRFLFIGLGAKRLWLEHAVHDRGLPNITIFPRVPREELSMILNACDVAIISFVPNMAGVSVPSRMYNIMAAGKPIIAVADENSELAQVVKEERIGWVVPPGNVDQIIASIQEAQANPVGLAEMGQRARQVAETKYSFERAIESYCSLIQGLGAKLEQST